MSNSVNNVTLVGVVGNDPEIRNFQGKNIGNISVATTESYKDKQGEWQQLTEWHKVNLFDYIADKAQREVKKGSKVYITGKLKTKSYEKDGVKRYVTEINAKELICFDKKENNDNDFIKEKVERDKNYNPIGQQLKDSFDAEETPF